MGEVLLEKHVLLSDLNIVHPEFALVISSP